MSSPEKKSYTLRSNLSYIYRELWNFSPKVCAVMVLFSILNVLRITFMNIIPKEVIRLVSSHSVPVRAFLWITLLVFLQYACSFLTMPLGHYQNNWGLRFRHHLERKALSRYLNTDYTNSESPHMRALYQKAREVFGNWDQDARTLMEQTTQFLASLLGIVSYASVIAALNPLILFFLLANALILDRISLYHAKWVSENSSHWIPIDVKKSYLEHIGQFFDYAKDIRLYGMSGWLNGKYESLLKERFYWCRQMLLVYFWKGSFFWAILDLLRNTLAYLVLIRMVLRGSITADQFVLYLAMITTLSSWIKKIMDSFREIRKCAVYLDDYRNLLSYPDQYDYESGLTFRETMQKDTPCSISFENVSFTYETAEKPTLKKINASIRPGEKIAIVGLNGAGKTTLIKNLCGLYKPTSGTIRIDGTPSTDFKHEEYYSFFSVVFQDWTLLPCTILENITLRSRQESDEKRAEECLRQAGLWKKVSSLPDGMNTYLHKGVYDSAVDFSGGEKQKLLLARAIYKDAPILILDEPTAALDPIAENRLYENYQALTKNRTSIYISHRLSSTRFCDRIFFLKDGEITEEGSHEELMAQGGEYARLFEIQSYYYRNNSTEEYTSDLDPDLGISGYQD